MWYSIRRERAISTPVSSRASARPKVHASQRRAVSTTLVPEPVLKDRLVHGGAPLVHHFGAPPEETKPPPLPRLSHALESDEVESKRPSEVYVPPERLLRTLER